MGPAALATMVVMPQETPVAEAVRAGTDTERMTSPVGQDPRGAISGSEADGCSAAAGMKGGPRPAECWAGIGDEAEAGTERMTSPVGQDPRGAISGAEADGLTAAAGIGR